MRVYARTMGVASNLSVIRGSFQRTFAVGSMQFVRCPESRSVRSWGYISTIVISIGATASVLYREVVRWWEGPLWEVPLYMYKEHKKLLMQSLWMFLLLLLSLLAPISLTTIKPVHKNYMYSLVMYSHVHAGIQYTCWHAV